MKFDLKHYAPYLIALLAICPMFNYAVDGRFILWKILLYIPLFVGGLWIYNKLSVPECCFSLSSVFKKYGFYMVLIPVTSFAGQYLNHRTLPIVPVMLIAICTILSFMVLERSIYE